MNESNSSSSPRGRDGSLTSETLLMRLRDPLDKPAWDEFVERYAPRILDWCRRYSLQEADAADVTQDILFRLMSAMRRFEYDPRKGRFRGWLKTVTANAVRDVVKHLKNRRGSGGDDPLLDSLVDAKSSSALQEAIESAYEAELLAVAEQRVQLRVQPHTWNAYRMAAVEQIPAATVAESLRIRVSDVYVAKSRVIKLLREQISELDTHL